MRAEGPFPNEKVSTPTCGEFQIWRLRAQTDYDGVGTFSSLWAFQRHGQRLKLKGDMLRRDNHCRELL